MKKIILNIVLFFGIALSVTAQNVYIPDANFKAYLVGRTDSINTNNDTVISVQEAEAFTGVIDVYYKNIKSLVGIEAFINLKVLNCSVNRLTNLDVTKNTNLINLYCWNNQLTSLDLTKNIKLITLMCMGNSIFNIDLTKNTELERLECDGNRLNGLNTNANIKLKKIICSANNITGLNLSSNVNLIELECGGNNLIYGVNLSKNIHLEKLNCYTSNLKNLDVSNNINLKELRFDRNNLTALDLTKNVNLESVNCSLNKLVSLDISNNTNLTTLDFSYNKLYNIDLSNNIKLSNLNCSDNYLKNLNVSKNINLNYLDYTGNSLNCVQVSNSQNKVNWIKDYWALYSINCTDEPGDFINNAELLTSPIIVNSTDNYLRGRNFSYLCNTTAADSNTIDVFYSFIADNSSVSMELTVNNPTWLSLMEIIPDGIFTTNPCLSNVDIGLSTRTYKFTNLTVGQEYLVRLELGDIAPLGHARISAANNTFGLKLISTVTDVSDNIILSNKIISNIYNLQGLEVSKDFRGLVIYKYTDGTTQKVVQE